MELNPHPPFTDIANPYGARGPSRLSSPPKVPAPPVARACRRPGIGSGFCLAAAERPIAGACGSPTICFGGGPFGRTAVHVKKRAVGRARYATTASTELQTPVRLRTVMFGQSQFAARFLARGYNRQRPPVFI